MSKTISLSLAQYRMLGRILRGEKLPIGRYKHTTVVALARKGCVVGAIGVDRPLAWEYTDLGKRIHACRGVLRADSQIWDSASNSERDAYKRVFWYHHRDDAKVVDRANGLMARMQAAGERPA